MKKIDNQNIAQIFQLLAEKLEDLGSPKLSLLVCGGSALVMTRLVNRVTKDVDLLAIDSSGEGLADPEPLPRELVEAAHFVAKAYQLPYDWLNTGPADIFRMGLPNGFEKRMEVHEFGPLLRAMFIGRSDQIHLKLYASVDRGGYHVQDLLTLKPCSSELLQAARWSMSHDVSQGYHQVLKEMLQKLGFDEVAQQL